MKSGCCGMIRRICRYASCAPHLQIPHHCQALQDLEAGSIVRKLLAQLNSPSPRSQFAANGSVLLRVFCETIGMSLSWWQMYVCVLDALLLKFSCCEVVHACCHGVLHFATRHATRNMYHATRDAGACCFLCVRGACSTIASSGQALRKSSPAKVGQVVRPASRSESWHHSLLF